MVIGYWLMVIGYWLLVIGYCFSLLIDFIQLIRALYTADNFAY